MVEAFRLLQEAGVLTAAFIIGAVAVVLAIIGRVQTAIDLPAPKAALLAAFGLCLIVLGIGGTLLSGQPASRGPDTSQVSTPGPLAQTTVPTEAALIATKPPTTVSQPTSAPPSSQPAVTQPSSAPPPQATLPSAANPPRLSRCQWLQQRFPQSREAIAQNLQIPASRVRVLNEGCPGIATGFVLELGDEIELQVPDGGCIDAPQDAGFTDKTVPDQVGGLRAFSGKVSAVIMTYRPLCEDSPRYQDALTRP